MECTTDFSRFSSHRGDAKFCVQSKYVGLKLTFMRQGGVKSTRDWF